MISSRIGSGARAHRFARVAAVFALAFGLIAAPHLTATTASATATPEPEDEGTARLSLSAGVHGVVQPGTPLTTSVIIDNGSDEALTPGVISIEINKTPLDDASALAAWLDAEEAEGTFSALGSEESLAVPASETSTAFVSASSSALDDLDAGVYPIRASLTGDDAPLTATSVLVLDAGSAPQVAVLVPITATPADGALLTAEELTELTDPDGALTAQLDGVTGTSAVLAIDPLIPASIRALGTAAPVSAVTWLTRLEALSNERFALQAGDADATVQARAGLTELLAPLPLTSLLTPENFVATETTPTPSPTPSPSPSGSPAEPTLPTTEELTAVSGAQPGILWPLGDARGADLATFDAYLGTDATTILPSSSLAATPDAVVEVDGHRVLVTDADASASLSTAAATIDDLAREREIAEAMAQLSFADQASLLVGLDRDETRSADALREAILSVSSIGQPTSFEDLRASASASATLDSEGSEDRATALKNLLVDEGRLTSFSSILADPLVLLAPERLAIMRLIGVGKAETFAVDSATHRADTTATLNSVGVQQPSPIQLFTAAAPLPVWVHNDLPWPVTVTLTSEPSDARLGIQPRTPVEAQPASNTRVKVPVEARVGSGELSVRFGLLSPTGVAIGPDQTATVTVRAEWEGIGLGILGGVIGLLLILGIIRTIVRRRKDDQATDESDAVPAPFGESEPTP
ncbi:DUF6049 family protein [Microbacterium aerolatum]|uniref:DUF6049 family protein n=1 Tax=Microbacterium aerolatum TaxID=153731 RepID=UPI002000EE53|nr:DUF6049 family protein [Microbacterium aerolatum]MCK3769326.1 DUF6049 family protein [Microbacterium aerolatum]